MEISTGAIAAALESLAAFEGRAVAALKPGELVAAQGAAALVRRTSEAMLAALAFEVGRRSGPELGSSGFAREHGFSSPNRMVAHVTGGSLGDATHLIDAGRAFAASTMPDAAGMDPATPSAPGLDNSASAFSPPTYPHLAASLAAGDIGASTAALICRTLVSLGEDASSVEAHLVARAGDLDLPVLLMHSDDDGYVPATGSRALAVRRPDIVTFLPFTVARHTKLWNYDRESWNQAITNWLGELVPTGRRSHPDRPAGAGKG